MKDRTLEGQILSYAWLPTKHRWADVLTKEMQLHDGFERVLTRNVMELLSVDVHKVRAVEGEIRMTNIRNCGVIEAQLEDLWSQKVGSKNFYDQNSLQRMVDNI